MLSITLTAVYWSSSFRLEGNFTFLSTISTNCRMHFSFIHSIFNSCVIYGKEASKTASSCTPHNLQRLINLLIRVESGKFGVKTFAWRLISVCAHTDYYEWFILCPYTELIQKMKLAFRTVILQVFVAWSNTQSLFCYRKMRRGFRCITYKSGGTIILEEFLLSCSLPAE